MSLSFPSFPASLLSLQHQSKTHLDLIVKLIVILLATLDCAYERRRRERVSFEKGRRRRRGGEKRTSLQDGHVLVVRVSSSRLKEIRGTGERESIKDYGSESIQKM